MAAQDGITMAELIETGIELYAEKTKPARE
jgi:hypothetical protein